MTLEEIANAIAAEIKKATFANVVIDFVGDEISIFAETEADYNAAKECMSMSQHELVDEDTETENGITYYTAFYAI